MVCIEKEYSFDFIKIIGSKLYIVCKSLKNFKIYYVFTFSYSKSTGNYKLYAAMRQLEYLAFKKQKHVSCKIETKYSTLTIGYCQKRLNVMGAFQK